MIGLVAPVLVSGWVVFWDGGESVKSLEANIARTRDVIVEWAVIDAEGNAVRRPAPPKELRDRVFAVARKHRKDLYFMVANWADGGFKPEPVTVMLRSQSSMDRHIGQLVRIAKEDGFGGIDVDYESMRASDRDAFSTFMERLRTRTRREGLKLSVAVHPKESEPGTWEGPQAHDWKRIGASVDVFRIMTYDFSWSTSPAGPIAPHPWAERVARFATTQMPAKKVEMGVPGYGYRWVGSQGRTVVWPEWLDLVRQHGPATADPTSGESVLRFGTESVFFATGESHRPKVEAIRRLGLRGFALWRFGGEDPGFWGILGSR